MQIRNLLGASTGKVFQNTLPKHTHTFGGFVSGPNSLRVPYTISRGIAQLLGSQPVAGGQF